MQLWAALPPPDYREDFNREVEFLGLKPEPVAGLLLFTGQPQPLAWAAVVWREVRRLPFVSISDAAKQLKPLAKKWTHHSGASHRRGELILDQLRAHKPKAVEFPSAFPEAGGVFTLENEKSLLCCLDYDRPDPEGIARFVEDKTAPSRAYLKLWEALSMAGVQSLAGERCLEVGASPGGWTWVLASLGASVTAVDRSPLAPAIAAMPGVEFRPGDAFQFTPEKMGRIDWLFSDLICYPEKLLEFIKLWLDSGQVGRLICTIKFQGKSDPKVIEEFKRLGRVLHLQHNKHELTWLKL